MKFTIFFDSQCPLCSAEMHQLKKHDVHKSIIFADLHSENFTEQYPYIDKSEAMDILHAQLSTGELLLGLDATYKAWSLVGKHKWLYLIRLPVIRVIADWFYLLFAKHRNKISYLLTGKTACTRCSLNNNQS